MSSDECLTSKMLKELKTTRSSIKTQNAAISDVLDKSNNVLLQIEASRSLKPVATGNSAPYTYKKEAVNCLIRIIDKFMDLLSGFALPTENPNFEGYLDVVGKRADYLGCNIRKILAITDTIHQMRMVLERQELADFNSEDESDVEDDF